MKISPTAQTGRQMHALLSRLFPIQRSLTGDGVRESLSILGEHLPGLEIHEVPTGTKCFDWEIPKEWNVQQAYIVTPDGRKICDIAKNNLHLVGYSTPVDEVFTLEDLLPRLHSLPRRPTAIPYLTSYYGEYWGFCISEEEKQSLKPGDYRVLIDSEFTNGSLTYGELYIPGQTEQEVFVSTYICHPSMANDQLSGPVVATFATKWLRRRDLRLSYRIVFVPETIGAIAFLSRRFDHIKTKIIAGFNLSCLGDDGDYSFVESRKANTLADEVCRHVLKHLAPDFKQYSFLQRGSDERQYCSPEIDLPLCTLCRTKFCEFPEYHTSLDDLNFVTPTGLAGGLELLINCLSCLENNLKLRMTVACEPQLGKRGLYPSLSVPGNGETVRNLTNLLAYADGTETLLEIANRLDQPFWSFLGSIDKLIEHDLIQAIAPAPATARRPMHPKRTSSIYPAHMMSFRQTSGSTVNHT